MAAVSIAEALAHSSAVVSRDRLNRIDPWANSGAIPIASNTGDGSSDPDEQAAPADAKTPRSESSSRIASASSLAKPMLVVFQRRGVEAA